MLPLIYIYIYIYMRACHVICVRVYLCVGVVKPFGVESGGGDDSDDDANHLYDGVLPLLPGRYRDVLEYTKNFRPL